MPGVIEALYQPFSLFCVHVMLWQRQRRETLAGDLRKRSSARPPSTDEQLRRECRSRARSGSGPVTTWSTSAAARARLAELLARAGLRVTGVEPAAYLRERFEAPARAVDSRASGRRRRRAAAVRRRRGAAPRSSPRCSSTWPTRTRRCASCIACCARAAVLCLSVPTSFTELLFWRLHPGYAENATHLRIFTKPELRRLIEALGSTSCAGKDATSAPPWSGCSTRCCAPRRITPGSIHGPPLGRPRGRRRAGARSSCVGLDRPVERDRQPALAQELVRLLPPQRDPGRRSSTPT